MKKLTCSCGAAIDTGASAPGTRIRCPKCKKMAVVPPAGATRAGAARPGASHGKTARKKGPNMAAIGGGAAGLVVLVIVLVMVLKKGDEPKPSPEDRAKRGVAAILDAHDPKTARDWLEVALDCKRNDFRKEYEEYLEKAVKLGPEDELILAEYKPIVQKWLDAIDRNDPARADQVFAVAERLEAVGLKGLAEHHYVQIAGGFESGAKVAGFAPKHPKANMKLDRVLTDYGTYDDRETWEGIKDKIREGQGIDKLPPWEKKIVLKKAEIERRRGGKMKFKVIGERPYVVAVQESERCAEELVAEDYRQVVELLYKVFRAEYAEKFGIQEVFEGDENGEILPIIVYESSEVYHEQNPQAPEWAGGHFSRRTGDIEIYQGVPDMYETIFHEGTHQLVGAATKVLGAKATNTHWLTEGIACYFEAFKRDAQFKINIGVMSDDYLGEVQLFTRKAKHLPFDMFIGRDYGTFMDQQEAIENPIARQKFVDLSYAQSWALVYFFRNHANGKYRDKFDQYFKAELEGKGTVELFTQIFGDVPALEKEWLDYVNALKPGG